MSRANKQPTESMEIETTSEPSMINRDFGAKSFILNEDPNGQQIHEENVRQLRQMNEEDLQDQRKQLMESMSNFYQIDLIIIYSIAKLQKKTILDPDLIKFLRSKRNAPKQIPIIPEVGQPMESEVANLSTLDILQDPNYEQWPNFDIVEPAKLQWMRDVDQKLPSLKPGETYEARFDWKGVLLPYNAAINETPASDERELYLHGEDAQRPGYTLQELFRLAR